MANEGVVRGEGGRRGGEGGWRRLDGRGVGGGGVESWVGRRERWRRG